MKQKFWHISLFLHLNYESMANRLFLYFMLLFSLGANVAAQESQHTQTNDFISSDSKTKFIYSSGYSSGKVLYHRDARLDSLLVVQKSLNKENAGIPGYRVQLYRGNQQKLSKDRAFEIESMVYQKLGNETDVEVIFTSPYWRVHAGNFRMAWEAMRHEALLKKMFPEIAEDISVVKSTIRFPDYAKNSSTEK